RIKRMLQRAVNLVALTRPQLVEVRVDTLARLHAALAVRAAEIPGHPPARQDGLGDVVEHGGTADYNMGPSDFSLRQIASANSVVVAEPRKSRVRIEPATRTAVSDCMIRSAAAPSSMCRSIRTADRSSAVGFARFFPAISGALPWTASKTAASAPRFAAPTTPRPPTRPAHRSDTMSPYKFGSSKTSNCDGFITRCMQAASTIRSSYVMSGKSRATRRVHSRNSPSLSFMMFALWIDVTRLRPCFRACANANCATRVDAFSVMIFKLSTTPGTT